MLAVVVRCTWMCAQPSWVPAGVPFLTTEMRNIYTDTVADAIYFCGASSIDGDFNFEDEGISVYSNGDWDTLGVFSNMPECIVRWGDTLVVGGGFPHINGLPMPYCAGWVAGQWVPFGDFQEVGPYKFRIIDGDLYAIGAFVHVDGHLCNGLAKRVGGEWENVGSMAGVMQNYLSDLTKYDGHLIMAGAVGFNWTSARGVAILNDTTWEPLGPGIVGTWGQGRALAVYQGDLYVGGAIDINDGNAGHGIMRWDGNQFHPVGDGFQGMYNDFSMPTGAVAMQVRNGLLYCSGQFRYAGHVPAMGVATWDGTNWCGFGGDLGLVVGSFDFYHDTLFVGPFHEAEGVDVNCAAKYIGSYPDTCSQTTTAIAQSLIGVGKELLLVVSPDHLQVDLPGGAEPVSISLHDAQGRLVDQALGRHVVFRTSGTANALYFVRAVGYAPKRIALTQP